MGRRPHHDACRRSSGLGARYVRDAYHMDYGAGAARYVDVYMEAIRWDNAAKLYERYSRET